MKGHTMKKQPIIVLDEHPDWLNPLYEEFKKREIPYEKVDISASSYDPAKQIVAPFYINRLSPSAGKRGHQAALQYAYNYLDYLESLGARVVNGAHTVLMETSKAKQAALMSRIGISHPKTVVVNDASQLLNYVDDFRFPVVVKPNCGGSGMGIQKFMTKAELVQAVADKAVTMPEEHVAILQEYIQPKGNHIVRVETINGKVIYAMKVFTQGTFNLCPSDSCDISRMKDQPTTDLGYCVATPGDSVRFELYKDIPKEIIQAVEKVVKAASLEVAGVEYVVDEYGKWYIYDINALSILRASFKDQYGIDGWGMLADYFQKEYEKTLKNRTYKKTI